MAAQQEQQQQQQQQQGWRPREAGVRQVLRIVQQQRGRREEQRALLELLDGLSDDMDFLRCLTFVFVPHSGELQLGFSSSQEASSSLELSPEVLMLLGDPSIRVTAGLVLKNQLLKRAVRDVMDIGTLLFIHDVVPGAMDDAQPLVRTTAGTIISVLVIHTNVVALTITNPELTRLHRLLLEGLQGQPAEIQTALSSLAPLLGILALIVLRNLPLQSQEQAPPATQAVGEASLIALSRITEDSPERLDEDTVGRPLLVFVPLWISYLRHPNQKCRELSLQCLNNLLPVMPAIFSANVENYLQGIAALSRDSSPTIRHLVCRGLNSLFETRKDVIEPHFHSIAEFTLSMIADDDTLVAREACQFWITLCEEVERPSQIIETYLSRLLPLLINRVVYTEDDLFELAPLLTEDAHISDRVEDIDPSIAGNALQHFQQHQHQVQLDEETEAEDYGMDDENGSSDSLRSIAALVVDVLCEKMDAPSEHILPLLLPVISERFKSDNWIIRESAILLLGAVAHGCTDTISEHLPQIFPFLIGQINDTRQHILLRATACWTVSRYAQWLVVVHQEALDKGQDDGFFQPALGAVLGRLNEKNKRIQRAAITAFAELTRELGPYFTPILQPMLQCIMQAFHSFQINNKLALLDVIVIMLDHVGASLGDPVFFDIFVPPLWSSFMQVTDPNNNHSHGGHSHLCDPMLTMITWTIRTIAFDLPGPFIPYSKAAYERALQMMENGLIASAGAQEAGEDGSLSAEDLDPLISALELISGIIEGIKVHFLDLLAQVNREKRAASREQGKVEKAALAEEELLQILHHCSKDDDPDLRRSALAVVGDLLTHCPSAILPHIGAFVPLMVSSIDIESPGLCNNSLWCLGLVALEDRALCAQFASSVLQASCEILATSEVESSVKINATITIGRIGCTCPESFRPELYPIFPQWCREMVRLSDPKEKQDTFRGLCAILLSDHLGQNLVQVVGPQVSYALICLVGFKKPPEDLARIFQVAVLRLKASCGSEEVWAAKVAKLSSPIRDLLHSKFSSV